MRINVYAEEMTNKIEIITKMVEGKKFTAVRFYLELPATVNGRQYKGPFIHRPGDDDSSAVTFWGKSDLRKMLRIALQKLDKHYANNDKINLTRKKAALALHLRELKDRGLWKKAQKNLRANIRAAKKKVKAKKKTHWMSEGY